MNQSSIASIFLDLLFSTIHDPVTGKFAPAPDSGAGAGKSLKEVAVKIAGTGKPRNFPLPGFEKISLETIAFTVIYI